MTVRTKTNRSKFWDSLVKGKQPELSVDVGVIGEDTSKRAKSDPTVTVADVALWNEYGLGRPQRSFLREYLSENADKIQKFVSSQMKKIAGGSGSLKQALDRAGVHMVGGVQRRISAGIPPENKPATIRRKGSDTPLIDTGQLRSSITSRSNV